MHSNLNLGMNSPSGISTTEYIPVNKTKPHQKPPKNLTEIYNNKEEDSFKVLCKCHKFLNFKSKFYNRYI